MVMATVIGVTVIGITTTEKQSSGICAPTYPLPNVDAQAGAVQIVNASCSVYDRVEKQCDKS